jgi:hypothetical protein
MAGKEKGGIEPQDHNELCDNAIQHVVDCIQDGLANAPVRDNVGVIIKWEVLTPYEIEPGRWMWLSEGNGFVDPYHGPGTTDCREWEHDLDGLPPADYKINAAEQSEELITNGR